MSLAYHRPAPGNPGRVGARARPKIRSGYYVYAPNAQADSHASHPSAPGPGAPGNPMSEGRRLRWGILGCGNIAGKFAKDLVAQGLPISGVASRDGARSEAFAALHGIPKSFGDYASLLGDSGVDAIYVALPNHLHAEWSVRAARAGKHVLCEKPASLSEAEAAMVASEARRARLFFMEGFMYALHPQWDLARALIEEDSIGRVRSLTAAFGYDLGEKPGNIRLSPEAWGGALNDVGCYGIHFARAFAGLAAAGRDGAGTEPRIASARARLGKEGVDEAADISLEFPGGVRAGIFCALREACPAKAVIEGERGRIEIAQPWHPAPDGAEVRLSNGDGETVYTAGDGLPALAREALHVEEYAAMGESPVLTREDAIAQARTMERIRAALDWS
jgi:xylose dehydrogenase (NAD/NADP)